MYEADVARSFQPFTGIAPRRYRQLFSVSGVRKNDDGTRKAWDLAERGSALPKVDLLLDQRGIAVREELAMSVMPESGGTELRFSTSGHVEGGED